MALGDRSATSSAIVRADFSAALVFGESVATRLSDTCTVPIRYDGATPGFSTRQRIASVLITAAAAAVMRAWTSGSASRISLSMFRPLRVGGAASAGGTARFISILKINNKV
jgi:hypothetical protein